MRQFVSAHVFALGLACAASIAPEVALAASVTVDNPSFESPATPAGTFDTDAPPTDWTAYGDSLDFLNRTIGVLNPATTTLYTEPVPDGSNVGVIFLMPSQGEEAGMEQTLDATLELMTDYTLTVEIGNIATADSPPHNAFDFDGFPGYRVELLAGTTVVASDNDTLLPPEGGFLTSTSTVSIGAAHANAGEALTIRLVNLDGAEGIEVNFDDVRLDASPPPECPASIPVGCKAADSGKSSLKFSRKNGSEDKDSVAWNWKGAETLPADLDDPTTTSDYLLCVYDGAGDSVLLMAADPAGTCGTKPCWKETSSGFAYKNSDSNDDGLTSMKLKAGAAGKAQVKIKGKGVNIEMPVLPLVLAPDPVTAVLTNVETAACWIAEYSTVKGDPLSDSKWQAKSD